MIRERENEIEKAIMNFPIVYMYKQRKCECVCVRARTSKRARKKERTSH